jgi:hypothetical protein
MDALADDSSLAEECQEENDAEAQLERPTDEAPRVRMKFPLAGGPALGLFSFGHRFSLYQPQALAI